jgi:SPP1 family predicted phage head-tail adaptor
MPAGELRHRITIKRNTPTRSAIGTPVDSWATVGTVWAKIEPADARALNYGLQRKYELSHVVTIRETLAVHEGDRVIWGTRIFTVNGIVMREEWDLFQQLHCHESRSNEGQ